MEDALSRAINADLRAVSLMEALGEAAREEEIVEGMQAEEEDDEDEEEDPEYDEHIWLSLRNAQLFVQVIAEELSALLPEKTEIFQANAEAYIGQLAALDLQYMSMTETAAHRTLLFGDRFPFRYLAEDYGLDYYAAFSGCSAETEASFQTIVFLAGKVDELSLPAVLTIEGTDHRIAETIVKSTKAQDQQILTVDSMQGTTSGDVKSGADYLKIMEKNLEVFSQALN